jgi:hypothetical protein
LFHAQIPREHNSGYSKRGGQKYRATTRTEAPKVANAPPLRLLGRRLTPGELDANHDISWKMALPQYTIPFVS